MPHVTRLVTAKEKHPLLCHPLTDSLSPWDAVKTAGKWERKRSWGRGAPILGPRAPWRDRGKPGPSQGSLHLTIGSWSPPHEPGADLDSAATHLTAKALGRQQAYVCRAGEAKGWLRLRSARELPGTRSGWKQAPRHPRAAVISAPPASSLGARDLPAQRHSLHISISERRE